MLQMPSETWLRGQLRNLQRAGLEYQERALASVTPGRNHVVTIDTTFGISK